MDLIRINPTKILVGGNESKAKDFIGPAKSQMEILLNQMSFQSLNQGIRKVWLNNDVYIECRKCFNSQECRIWFRPDEGAETYFYVRIVQSASAPDADSEFLNKSRDDRDKVLDRLILWKCRSERKTDAYEIASTGQQSGEYEDGTGWIITKPGEVILDVDVISRTAYLDGIVITDLTLKEAALKKADTYLKKIDENEQAIIKNPVDLISQSMFKGSIYSPFDIADTCNNYTNYIVDSDTIATFADPVPLYWGSVGGEIKDWYHVIYNDYDLMELDPHIKHDCWDQPETKFFETPWPGLDINKDKYLPTQRKFKFTDISPGINATEDPTYYKVCQSSAMTVEVKWLDYAGGDFEITYDLLVPPNFEGSYRAYNCSLVSEYDDIEHVAGNYYTSTDTYPCFFVTLCGRSTPVTGSRVGGLWGNMPGSSYDNWYTYGIEEHINYDQGYLDYNNYLYSIPTYHSDINKMTFEIDEGVSFLSTPLEQAIISNEYTKYVEGENEPSDWIKQFFDFTGGANGSILIVGEGMINWAQSAYPSIASLCAETLSYPSYYGWCILGLDITIIDKTEDFSNTASFVSLNGKKFSSLVIFREINARTVAQKRSQDIEGNTHFNVGMVFYIMYPKYAFLVDGSTTTYWDIHNERESSQEEINHNRELDLEEYITNILVEIKSDTANIDPSTDYYLRLKDQWYDMTTGFISKI